MLRERGAGRNNAPALEQEGNSTDPHNRQIGFRGGEAGPLIDAFELSYTAEPRWVDPEIELATGCAGGFSDPAAGEPVVESEAGAGTDIIYHGTATGPGIREAAPAANRFANGADGQTRMSSAVREADESQADVARGGQAP